MKKKLYAVYLNDELVAVGSAKKLARELGVKPSRIPNLSGGGMFICEIEDEIEDDIPRHD